MSRKEGLSNEEISLKLNINKRTVENHITQALADLRKVLKIVLPFLFKKITFRLCVFLFLFVLII